ncbi:MAG TPA: N-acyl-D-glucosamine 2-epimerase [Bacteroidales bacterium]|nr:N-acyl-D-glucosamine 2-epimerase [Bacteroidales bacterium]
MKNNSELHEYRKIFENELHSILSYWMKYSMEEESKGFYGAVDLDNRPVLSANKSCVLNARILWTFSEAARLYPGKGYQDIAHLAYRVVTEDFADRQFGGYYMELSSGNKVVNDTKHTYVQAFVLYSLSKYYEYNPDLKVIKNLKDYFIFLDNKTRDTQNPGYLESFSREWKLSGGNRMADNNEPKSMNTHLHLLEAYAAAYRVWKDEKVRKRLAELIDIFTGKIIRNSGHLGLFFSNEFEETAESAGICSFGHDIEASWLIPEAAEILGDKAIVEKINPHVRRMADAVLREGVDKDGGLFLESYRYGSHIRTNKHWWIQAENLVGFMNMYQLTGDNKYWETVKQAWDFIHRFVIDHERGEWFTKVNRLGKPFRYEPEDDPSPYYKNNWKIDPWKCPYHNGRAMMELVKRINILLES